MTDCFVFTINNYTEEEEATLKSISAPYSILFGHEVGAKGTPHLQGMIWREDMSRMRRDRTEKLLGGRAHIEVCHAFEESLAYCCKDVDIYCNQQALNDLAKTLFKMSNCRAFIGCCLYNAIFGTEYNEEFLNCVLEHHKHFHKNCPSKTLTF